MNWAIRARGITALAAVFFVLFLSIDAAQAAHPAQHRVRHDGRHAYHDRRHHHNHYYPSRGYIVRHLPHRHHVIVGHSHRRYFYSGGVWYAPRGPRFVVVSPPIGVFVPVLPSFYTTVWFGGIPYYYANDAYYVWRSRRRAYEVVEAPRESSAGAEAPPGEELFVYPKNGQSEERTARDRYECHRWAAGETGFDPTRAGGGVPAEQNRSKRSDYHRAMSACLEGRGYSVK